MSELGRVDFRLLSNVETCQVEAGVVRALQFLGWVWHRAVNDVRPLSNRNSVSRKHEPQVKQPASKCSQVGRSRKETNTLNFFHCDIEVSSCPSKPCIHLTRSYSFTQMYNSQLSGNKQKSCIETCPAQPALDPYVTVICKV